MLFMRREAGGRAAADAEMGRSGVSVPALDYVVAGRRGAGLGCLASPARLHHHALGLAARLFPVSPCLSKARHPGTAAPASGTMHASQLSDSSTCDQQRWNVRSINILCTLYSS